MHERVKHSHERVKHSDKRTKHSHERVKHSHERVKHTHERAKHRHAPEYTRRPSRRPRTGVRWRRPRARTPRAPAVRETSGPSMDAA
jgi:hypothetical protein